MMCQIVVIDMDKNISWSHDQPKSGGSIPCFLCVFSPPYI